MSKQTRKNPSKSEAMKKPATKSAAAVNKSAATPSASKAAAKAKPAGAAKAKATGKTSTAKSAASAAAGPAEGAKAPVFSLPRDGGETVTLASFSGKKLVLFFYPRANTPGCTKEAIDFTRLKQAFDDCGTAVVGVSADSVKAQDSFRDKHGLATPLLSDPTHAMLAAYGAWGEKSLYGRKFEGIIRSTVLIGRDGKIARVWRNVKVDGHADQVLAAAQLL
ncbi:peroxiredoxin [Rhodopseudomonas palustris]|uniref:peroxiredoxin n=1 Tax=Rhodopseudomonas palustris TaxID=1076 RepID=UPI002ACE2D6B|nr:peroxiredoxin [Rhodopseudomonas palustris]WQH01962.1 peroxiredoxin [Rhodopseudomonas palustris]